MRTVGKHRSSSSPRGDTLRCCGYCGALYYRSQLRRDAAGILACPDELPGLDSVSLSEGNAALASRRGIYDRGETDGTVDSRNTVAPPGLNWNGITPAPLNTGPTGQLSALTLLWARADSVTLDGAGNVATWIDLSGSQNSIPATTALARPLWAASDVGINGKPALTFDGVNHFLFSSSLKTGAPLWVWMVIKQLGWANGGTLLNLGIRINQATASPSIRIEGNASEPLNSAAAIGSWSRVAAKINVAGTDELLIHGTSVADSSHGQRMGASVIVGALNSAGGLKANFSIAELLITTPQPSATEIAAVDAYGASRYGSSIL